MVLSRSFMDKAEGRRLRVALSACPQLAGSIPALGLHVSKSPFLVNVTLFTVLCFLLVILLFKMAYC